MSTAIGVDAAAVAALPSAVRWSFSRTCVVEQRLAGTELSVEGWARDGAVTVAAVTAKTLTPGTFIEEQHLEPADAGPHVGALIGPRWPRSASRPPRSTAK